MYNPAAGSGDEGSSVRGASDVEVKPYPMGITGKDLVSFMNIAEVRPVRQPWSRWVAHQSSSSTSFVSPETFVASSGSIAGK